MATTSFISKPFVRKVGPAVRGAGGAGGRTGPMWCRYTPDSVNKSGVRGQGSGVRSQQSGFSDSWFLIPDSCFSADHLGADGALLGGLLEQLLQVGAHRQGVAAAEVEAVALDGREVGVDRLELGRRRLV